MNSITHTIIYFTGTGNSLAVARLLAQRLPGSNIISVNKLLKQSKPEINSETCGFIFPVYCQDTPEIVKRLVRRLEFPADTYIFAVATHNGDVGRSHFSLNRILKKKRRRLQAGFAVLMPGNSINPYNMNDDMEIQRRLKETADCVDKISDDVTRRASLNYAGSASLRKHVRGFRNILRYKVVFKVPKSFWTTDACNLCGLCVRICPENNISLDTSFPVWGSHCQMCFACIHWCPQQAVQNGLDTINRKRYHHPDITIDDMLLRENAEDMSISQDIRKASEP